MSMSVCLSTHITQKLHSQTSPYCFVRAASGRGSVLLRWHCDMLYTSSFGDDVIFSYDKNLLHNCTSCIFISGIGTRAAFCSTIKTRKAHYESHMRAKSAIYDCLAYIVHCHIKLWSSLFSQKLFGWLESVFWVCPRTLTLLGDRNGNQPVTDLLQLPQKVIFWKTWPKLTVCVQDVHQESTMHRTRTSTTTTTTTTVLPVLIATSKVNTIFIDTNLNSTQYILLQQCIWDGHNTDICNTYSLEIILYCCNV